MKPDGWYQQKIPYDPEVAKKESRRGLKIRFLQARKRSPEEEVPAMTSWQGTALIQGLMAMV